MINRKVGRVAFATIGMLALWQLVVSALSLPRFMLPGPIEVMSTLLNQFEYFAFHASITAVETLLGLLLGIVGGVLLALVMGLFKIAKRFVMPILIVSQALPVFAIAPLLVLWFGYGMASKVVMASLIIFFPVTSYFFDGIRRTEPSLVDLGRLYEASRVQILFQIRVPHALPSLSSGLRVSAVFAPIGAIVGEWVGSSAGLGFIMLHANARMQTESVFAALLFLGTMALVLRYTVYWATTRLIPWQNEE